MTKKLDADSAATQVNDALQPAVDFRVTTAHDARQDPPTPNPLPATLKKALGVGQLWKKS